METKISSAKSEVIISDKGPTMLIGERLNPSGRKKLQEALKNKDFEYIRKEAIAQVAAGANILDVNVSTSGVDEVAMLPEVIKAVMSAVDVPLCIDINDHAALRGAIKVYKGKPIINSVSGEEKSLKNVLPVVKEYGAAVIGLTISDEEKVPKDAKTRLKIAKKIVDRAEALGIPREDIIIDSLSISLGANDKAAVVTLETIRLIKAELGVNQTLGGSNVSHGLPDRVQLNRLSLAMFIEAGLTCPVVNAADVKSAIVAIDLLRGQDRLCMKYLADFRKRNAAAAAK